VSTTAAPTAPAAPSGPAPGPDGFWRRHRSTLVILVGAVLAVTVAVVLGTGTANDTALDPDNPGPDGTRALARVLEQDGVHLTVARDADAFDRARVDGNTTVVVVQPAYLGQSTIRRMLDHSRVADRLVVVDAGPGFVDALGLTDDPGGVPVGRGRSADCDDPLFSGLTIQVDSAVAYAHGACFRGAFGGLVDEPADGPAANLVLFGAGQALTNDQVLRADNAAVALRLLGQQPRVVWYLPSLDDLVGADGVSVRSLLPLWLLPGLWLGAVVLVSLVVWRGRRLGALATEPLPVVVRASETTRSLGRLYRRSGDRAHAAETLRRAARRRLAEGLRLGSAAPPDAVVREVARRAGRDEAAVRALLGPGGAVPSTDRDLVTLADDLDQLDREVFHA
jgi:hypothetical protein